jgi:hypothetical protein
MVWSGRRRGVGWRCCGGRYRGCHWRGSGAATGAAVGAAAGGVGGQSLSVHALAALAVSKRESLTRVFAVLV